MKNIALVLSEGGARGCAHIGAIKILEEQGFNIKSIAGTSMGALVGGIYACGGLRNFEEWICSLDIYEILKLTDFPLSSKGLVKGVKVMQKLRDIVPDRQIEDLPIPYCAIATDILTGKEKVFNEGDLFDAIRASISIPTVFRPHNINDCYYVDGGLLNPIPVNRVKRSDDDLLVVVDVSAPIPSNNKTVTEKDHPVYGKYSGQIKKLTQKFNHYLPEKKQDEIGFYYLTNKSIGTMMRKISDLTLEKHKPDILISISKEAYNIFEFYKAAEIIKEGELAALNALNSLSDH